MPKKYVPSVKEKYMCEKHKAFFKKKLVDWKSEIIELNSKGLYLKDVYRAKNYQEKALNNYRGYVNKLIYRPKALSYGKTLLDSTSRYDLAGRILEDLNM